MRAFGELTYDEVEGLDPARTVLLQPMGAIEAHGPHLPLATDVIIAEAMARAGGERLAKAGFEPLLLPAIVYTPAGFAASFAGTVSLSRETLAEQLVALARAVASWGLEHLVLVNAHFDPDNLGAIYSALDACGEEGLPRPIFPDVTRKPWALRLTDEFKSGACHAGRYEGSIVLAERPELVRPVGRELPANPISLSDAIRRGRRDFLAAGGERAYFGYPSEASAEEGRATVETLGEILYDAVREALGSIEKPTGDEERRE